MNRADHSPLALGWWCLALAAAALILVVAGPGLPSLPPLRSPSSWTEWLEVTGPAPAAVALVRLGTLAVVAYLGAVTVTGVAVRLLAADGLVVLVDRVTVPALRRLLSTGLGAGLALGPLTAVQPALAQPAPAERTLTMRGLAESPATDGETRGEPATAGPAMTMSRVEEDGPDGVAPERTVRVEPGQSFWSIAEDVLRATGRDHRADREVVPYWLRLIEANRQRLADPANPDLVFPGQVLTVPQP